MTAAFFYEANKYKYKINIIEAGLFHRFDATNIIKSNLVSIVTAICLDHLDWLPKNEQIIDKIIYEPQKPVNKNVVSQLIFLLNA